MPNELTSTGLFFPKDDNEAAFTMVNVLKDIKSRQFYAHREMIYLPPEPSSPDPPPEPEPKTSSCSLTTSFVDLVL